MLPVNVIMCNQKISRRDTFGIISCWCCIVCNFIQSSQPKLFGWKLIFVKSLKEDFGCSENIFPGFYPELGLLRVESGIFPLSRWFSPVSQKHASRCNICAKLPQGVRVCECERCLKCTGVPSRSIPWSHAEFLRFIWIHHDPDQDKG